MLLAFPFAIKKGAEYAPYQYISLELKFFDQLTDVFFFFLR